MGLVRTPLDELTYTLNGLAMTAQHELKAGQRERVYQYRLADLARNAGLWVETEKRVEVFVNETLIGFMFIDLWIEQTLIVECKTHDHQLTNDEIGQVITYLAATGSPVGLLYNFGRSKLEFKRILPPKNIHEWHKHLYRSIWTPPGKSLPPLETIRPETPIRFSVLSQSTPPLPANSTARELTPTVEQSKTSTPPAAGRPPASVSVRLSASPPQGVSVVDSAYAASGVNIDAGNRAVELMRESVRATYGPEVLAGIGAFGGLFSAEALKAMRHPVLVASTDGVGTKVKLAAKAGRYQTIGQDIVNHCVNDILVQGARPLFFLDYIASAALDPEQVAAVVRGIASACQAAGCALIGGETAEMPGVYQPGEFDVAGTVVGVVERESVLPRADLKAGDVLIGLRSSGPHTNGYSLIRRIIGETPLDQALPGLGGPATSAGRADAQAAEPALGGTLADALLAPHRSYLAVLPRQAAGGALLPAIKALAHLTGGGFLDNLPRVLPDHLSARVHPGRWPIPPVFTFLQQRGEIETGEMYRVFNMGIGMVVVAAPEDAARLQSAIEEETFVIGELVPGDKKVILQ